MVTILLCGDPHFQVNNAARSNQMIEKFIQLAVERKPTFIVVLGDVLHTHEKVHVNPLCRAIGFLWKLSQISPLYVMIGNHDRSNPTAFLTEEHPFTSLKHWKNTYVVDKTLVATIEDHIFTFVPYVSPGRFVEALDTTEDWKKSSIIFAHQEFKNAKMGAALSTVGDEWPSDYPYVMSGHIHDYDQLQPNLLYTGTPMQHAFGDKDDKTVSWVTISDKIVHKRIDLGISKKILVRLTALEVEYYEPPTEGEIKIIITDNSAALKVVMKMAKVKVWISRGIKISYKDLPGETSVFVPRKIKQKYGDLLFEMVQNNNSLRGIYEELFGKTEKPKVTLKVR